MQGSEVFGKRRLFVDAALIVVSVYFTLYTMAAYAVSRNIIENGGELWWNSGGSGTLLPWPRESGILTVLTKVNEIDLFIYRYLLKS